MLNRTEKSASYRGFFDKNRIMQRLQVIEVFSNNRLREVFEKKKKIFIIIIVKINENEIDLSTFKACRLRLLAFFGKFLFNDILSTSS